MIWSFPVYLLAVALAATLEVGGLELGPLHVSSTSIWIPIVIIALVFVPYVARPIRGQVLSLRRQEFVEAAVAHGAGSLRVMASELLPNVMSSALIFFTLIVANNILIEAALSFLGVGRPAAHALVGQHHRAGLRADRDVTGADHRAGDRDPAHGRVAERPRRRTARRARPARRHEDPGLTRFVLKRIAGMLGVLVAVSILVFLIFNVIPGGDPALRMAGRRPTQENIVQIRKKWGFDRPYWVQYGDMLDHLFIKRDMISYQDQTPVLPTIERGIPRTLSLAIGAAIIWTMFGIGIGVISGVQQGRFADRALTILSLGGISTPIFWLGAVLLYLLTFRWHDSPLFNWIPAGGYVPFAESPAAVGGASRPAMDRPVRRLDRLLRARRARLADRDAVGRLRAHGPRDGPVAQARAARVTCCGPR